MFCRTGAVKYFFAYACSPRATCSLTYKAPGTSGLWAPRGRSFRAWGGCCRKSAHCGQMKLLLGREGWALSRRRGGFFALDSYEDSPKKDIGVTSFGTTTLKRLLGILHLNWQWKQAKPMNCIVTSSFKAFGTISDPRTKDRSPGKPPPNQRRGHCILTQLII